MKLPKLRLTRKSDADLVQSATVALHSMRNNADKFPDSEADLAELESTLALYAGSTQAVREAKLAFRALVDSKNSHRKSVQRTLRRVANRVEAIAQGNEELIHDAGMTPTNDPLPVYMTQVTGLTLTTGVKEGELLARWKPVRRVHMYRVQVCKDTDSVPTNWKDKFHTSKASCSLNSDLISGSKVWVRVCAFGAQGEGPWSQPVQKTVP